MAAGGIALPLVRIEASAKCAKGVGLIDVAAYLDSGWNPPARSAASSAGGQKRQRRSNP